MGRGQVVDHAETVLLRDIRHLYPGLFAYLAANGSKWVRLHCSHVQVALEEAADDVVTPGIDVYAGRYHVIGGFFERDLDMATTRPDPFAAICREIREETGIQLKDVSEQYCLGVVYDLTTPHGEMCFLTRLNISIEEVYRCVPEENEIQQLLSLYITKGSLRHFILANHGNISATGEPNLLMYGAVKFGEEWFEEVMGRLSSL